MIKVRLARTGTKKTPMYRIVVADSRDPRDGQHLENIGIYNPRAEAGKGFRIDLARLAYWQGVGAKLSTEVGHLVRRNAPPAT